MNVTFFVKKDDETNERFLLKTETDVVPCIRGRVMFQDFEKVDELNIYEAISVDYIYIPNEPKPDIEVILKPLKML